jgi:toxin ParE1/3/4
VSLRISSVASEELTRSALYYLEASPKAALDFQDEVEEAFQEIADFPTRYPIESGDHRVKVLKVFPFSIRYRIKGDEVEILTISHQARRPDYWRINFG